MKFYPFSAFSSCHVMAIVSGFQGPTTLIEKNLTLILHLNSTNVFVLS